jgi:hypothetical protein
MNAKPITYSLMFGTRSIGIFDTLEHARRFAEGIVGHTITLWDSAGAYYGTWYFKEGWIH